MSLTYTSIRSDIEERITKYPNTFVRFISFYDIFYESMSSARPRKKRGRLVNELRTDDLFYCFSKNGTKSYRQFEI